MTAVYKSAAPYANDALNLPVASVEEALPFYLTVMGFQLLSRETAPHVAARLGRDAIAIGLAENGGDPTQEGCFFEVDDVEAAFTELQANGLNAAAPKFRIDRHGETDWRVFFVVAPDGLCYCLGERVVSKPEIVQAAAHPLAVIRARANQGNIAQQIVALLGSAWQYARDRDIGPRGHNIVVYLHEPGRDSFCGEEGVAVEIGLEVAAFFTSDGPVVPSTSPSGPAAMLTHIGPYKELGRTHDALRQWCQDNGHNLAGPAWEVYGHWIEGMTEAEARTEVYYLLQ